MFRIRGKLGSLMILFFNLGILVGYICGKSLDYITVPKVLILLPILFVVGFIFLPNTPQYLLKRNQLYVCVSENVLNKKEINILLLMFTESGDVSTILSKLLQRIP